MNGHSGYAHIPPLRRQTQEVTLSPDLYREAPASQGYIVSLSQKQNEINKSMHLHVDVQMNFFSYW